MRWNIVAMIRKSDDSARNCGGILTQPDILARQRELRASRMENLFMPRNAVLSCYLLGYLACDCTRWFYGAIIGAVDGQRMKTRLMSTLLSRRDFSWPKPMLLDFFQRCRAHRNFRTCIKSLTSVDLPCRGLHVAVDDSKEGIL